jgi:hypothetical protein
MSATVIILIDLLVLGLLIAYWEWRYREYGWGRGWLRTTAATWASAHYPPPNPDLERFVWGPDEDEPTIPVRRVPKDWDFDLDLPPAGPIQDS